MSSFMKLMAFLPNYSKNVHHGSRLIYLPSPPQERLLLTKATDPLRSFELTTVLWIPIHTVPNFSPFRVLSIFFSSKRIVLNTSKFEAANPSIKVQRIPNDLFRALGSVSYHEVRKFPQLMNSLRVVEVDEP